eukprot:CAMPEP_0172558848 /NCGR_PEP_ID=MMETSP1067-20121228/81230_1 /TAXON_ID=265564 ORGANISM="Thalassiosira punctigera, Strain Tpunct2005C2" /NCGR_SAMPLE_ID=MMETSP1067 /ASSEMBLY_ACC=CAM_ASM_000444 /LENGTH=666 /DNA_ID=CAMNT_0013348301 /DNA_START=5 /DNA_END=2008 /DNA_ORIENTATION=+
MRRFRSGEQKLRDLWRVRGRQYHVRRTVSRPVPIPPRAKTNGAILATCVGTAMAVICSSRESSRSHAEKNQGGDDVHHLEMYLMDRIARKPYLNYHSTPSSVPTARHLRGRQNEERPADDDAVADKVRPKGVPSRLRLLAIDVPQFKREAFERGICRLPSEVFDRSVDEPSFVDGVAPPKPMNETLGNYKRTGTRASRKPIVQKSLAKQLYYCYEPPHKNPAADNDSATQSSEDQNQSSTVSEQDQPRLSVGVEILEASIMNLNPNNIRRTYTSVSGDNWRKRTYKFDPGKYTQTEGNASDDDNDDECGIADVDEDDAEKETLEPQACADARQIKEPANDDPEEIDIDNPDYERTSPWNQYAWLEEMHLRANGVVPFGAPMQRAHPLSRWMYGRIYRQAIPASPSRGGWVSWLWWPVLWSGSHAIGSERHRLSWDGVDGEGENVLYGSDVDSGKGSGKIGSFLPWMSPSKAALNRASNKPHAVICDGAAMQRVPGSLRYLAKICREAQIPLYILNDPRSWGSQTHPTLSDAIVDLRKTVSDNVIRNALALREGSAFERGRFVGQLEKEMAWQAYDAARKTREALMDARRRLRLDKVEDWGELTEEQLMKKLIERRVITLQDDDEASAAGTGSEGKLKQPVKCSEAFTSICCNCLETQIEEQPAANS